MKQIKLLKPYQDYKIGSVITVSNNVAHGLIEDGVAKEYATKIVEGFSDKMMRPETKINTSSESEKTSTSQHKKSKNTYKAK